MRTEKSQFTLAGKKWLNSEYEDLLIFDVLRDG